jgi:hypothetical protein
MQRKITFFNQPTFLIKKKSKPTDYCTKQGVFGTKP